MGEERLSYCRICAAACGIVVTLDDERVVRVRGDAGHPASRGYTCSKGRGLAEWHHRSDRLDRPRVRGVEVGWDEALDDLASVLGSTIAGSGPDAVALYLATGMAYDSAGQVSVATWLSSIGSRSMYTAATVDNAPVLVAAELVAANAMLNPVWEPDGHGLLLLVGTNPVVSHGYGTALPDPVSRLRGFRRAGGRIWVLDPRRTESAGLADEHLSTRPGADVVVLAALAAGLLAEGADEVELSTSCTAADVSALRTALEPFTIERAAAAAGVDAGSIDRLLADLRANCGRVAAFCGTGTTMATDGVLTEWLRWVLLILTGSLDRPGGMRFQHGIFRLAPPRPPRPPRPPKAADDGPRSRPDLTRVVNQVPAVALADEIEGGHVRALVVAGGNPIDALPEPDRMRAALGRLDALVVLDVVESELTGIATHVFPATGQLERADVMLTANLHVRSAVQSTRPVVAPAAERRPLWWMLGSLSERMGGALLGDASPDDLTDETYLCGLLAHSTIDAGELFGAGPHGVEVPVEYGWVHETMLPGGHWQLAPPVLLERLAAHREPFREGGLVLTPRREMGWSNSIRYGGTGDEPLVRLSPADAEAAGVSAGSAMVVTSAHGEVEAIVEVDDAMRPGVVSMTHGHPIRSPGRLTSSGVDVDPLTAMPHASGLAVSIRPSSPSTR